MLREKEIMRAEMDDHLLTVPLSVTAPLSLSSPLRLVVFPLPVTLLYHIPLTTTENMP
jgi:hypothetical protein